VSGWIKFEKDLLTDPRVLRIAKSLERRWIQFDGPPNGLEQYDPCNAVALPAVTLVCGALVRMWCLADTHIDENDVLPLGKSDLDDVLGLPGFCDLLPLDWLILIDDSHVKLPGFHEHNGTEAKKKAVTQKRVERHRNRNAAPLQGGNGRALPDQDQDQDLKKRNGATAPLKTSFWDVGESHGITRPTIGRMIRDHGEEAVSDALRNLSLRSNKPADATQYVFGILKNKAPNPMEGAI
jgi:hypothetical protein